MHWALQRTSPIIRLVLDEIPAQSQDYCQPRSHSAYEELKGGALQINALPFPTFDSCANFLWSLPLLCLLIGVNSLLHACGTGRPVRSLEAAVEAIVLQSPVTMAIAWLLMQHCWNLRRHLICDHLVGMRKVHSVQLIAAQHRGKSPGWSRCVISRYIFRWIRPLRRCHHRD
jgi:hypothetical protein